MEWAWYNTVFVLICLGIIASVLWLIWAVDQYPASTAKTDKYPSRAYRSRYAHRGRPRRG